MDKVKCNSFSSCVNNVNCQRNGDGIQNEELGSCYDVNAPPRNVEKSCCKDENIINPPQKCSVLAEHKYR